MVKNLPPDVGEEGQPATKKPKPPQRDNRQMKSTISFQQYMESPANFNPTSGRSQHQTPILESPRRVLQPTDYPNPLQFNNQTIPSQPFTMNHSPGFLGQPSRALRHPSSTSTMNPTATRFFGQPSNAPDHPHTPAASTGAANMRPAPVFIPITRADYTGEYMRRLRGLVHPAAILEKKGYVLEPLTAEDLERKKKCKNCGKPMKYHKDPRAEREDKVEGSSTQNPSHGNNNKYGKKLVDRDKQQTKIAKVMSMFPKPQGKTQTQVSESGELPTNTSPFKKEPILRCRFHDGVKGREWGATWSCCKKQFHEEGCRLVEHHIPKQYEDGELENLWQCYATPIPTTSSIRSAVAIDCEMGIATSNDSELIRVTLVDYFTSEVLVDSLVYPDVPIKNFNTRYSGVTLQDMNRAINTGQCLYGKKGAREAVWRFVGPDTVVVAHSAQNDLSAMRWIHSVVVDTYLVDYLKEEERRKKIQVALAVAENEALAKEREKYGTIAENNSENHSFITSPNIRSIVTPSKIDDKDKVEEQKPKKPKGSGSFSLKTMALVKLGRQVQMAGNQGHDSLEDAIASRDIAHWHVLNKDLPEEDLMEFSDDDGKGGGGDSMGALSAKFEGVLRRDQRSH